MFPLIVGTVAVTALSFPAGRSLQPPSGSIRVGDGSRPVREFLKPVLEILGFFPSIVLGFIGMVVLAPMLQERFDMLSGLNLFNASVLLGVLTIPVVSSLLKRHSARFPKIYGMPPTHWEQHGLRRP